ncbi:hypothetical protein [Yoonia sp. MH D7]
MIKYAIITVGLLSIAGCTTMDQREAKCACFNSDGSASGSCDFARLPGQPAVFSFMAVEAPSPRHATPEENAIRKELCGG